MLLEASDSQLVLVDYQERLMAALSEREPVLANARRLAQAARRSYARGMAQTRRRGTRPDFVQGWEYGTLPEEEVMARGADLFNDGHGFVQLLGQWNLIQRSGLRVNRFGARRARIGFK